MRVDTSLTLHVRWTPTRQGTKGAVHAILTIDGAEYSLGKSTEMPERALKTLLRFYRQVAHIKKWQLTEKTRTNARRGSRRGGTLPFRTSDP